MLVNWEARCNKFGNSAEVQGTASYGVISILETLYAGKIFCTSNANMKIKIKIINVFQFNCLTITQSFHGRAAQSKLAFIFKGNFLGTLCTSWCTSQEETSWWNNTFHICSLAFPLRPIFLTNPVGFFPANSKFPLFLAAPDQPCNSQLPGRFCGKELRGFVWFIMVSAEGQYKHQNARAAASSVLVNANGLCRRALP